jgi:S-adenosylmethionine synthetase
MTLQISRSRRDPARHPIEVVERKGAGHPDTLSDHLAEALSRAYSRYTQARFGMVLRHQFDKTALMCGRCKVSFGAGEMVEPIRILVNGRASARLGDEPVPVRDILLETVKDFIRARLPNLDPERDVRVLYEVRDGMHSTTGGIFGDQGASDAAIHYRFHPRTLEDLPEFREVQSNDTSLGCASGPYTPLERLVLEIETRLRQRGNCDPAPWVGSDIKTMAVRRGSDLTVTVAAPVLSAVTASAADYFARVEIMEQVVRQAAAELMPDHQLSDLCVNAADDLNGRKLYMNFSGSSIESGDEGMVGRGNRIGGVIAPMRPWTMEGISGKNPVYHVGKVYSVAAYEIAQRLSAAGIPTSVYLLNRMGVPLRTPWVAQVEIDPDQGGGEELIGATVEAVLGDLPGLTEGILAEKYVLA